MTFAEELRVRDQLSAFDAVIAAAKIRLRPRLMTTLPIIMGLIPLALNFEEGGDMLQPMAVGAIGGLIMLIPVALFLMSCVYVIFTRERARYVIKKPGIGSSFPQLLHPVKNPDML